jgi:hypothetical protein
LPKNPQKREPNKALEPIAARWAAPAELFVRPIKEEHDERTREGTRTEVIPLINRAVMGVREDMRDNPYILEAIRVLPHAVVKVGYY